MATHFLLVIDDENPPTDHQRGAVVGRVFDHSGWQSIFVMSGPLLLSAVNVSLNSCTAISGSCASLWQKRNLAYC
jgi:hypothetical protein